MGVSEKPNGVKKVQSVVRALKIIEVLGNHESPMTLSEICKDVKLNMSTVYRLIQTLVDRDFVNFNPLTGKYRLSMKTFRIGNSALYALDFRAEARPLMEELVSKCGETANLVILDNGDTVYIEQVESTNMVKMLAKLGSRLPATCTGGGKAILAHLPEEEVDRILKNRPLRRYTDNTITDPDQFKRELSNIRNRGVALDWEEREPGVRCVAAPVFNHTGDAAAALSVSGPSTRLTEDQIERVLIPLVKEYAAAISSRLGYRAAGLSKIRA